MSSQYLQIQPEQKLWAQTRIAADGTEEEFGPQPLLTPQPPLLSSVRSLPASGLSAFSSIHRAEVSVHPGPQDNA